MRNAAARAGTTKKRQAEPAAVKPAPAKKAPAKSVPAKKSAANKPPAKNAPARKVIAKKAPRARAAAPAPAAVKAAPVKTAAKVGPQKLLENLRRMGDQRPGTRAPLLRLLKSHLGAGATADDAQAALRQLQDAGHLAVSAAGRVTYTL